MNGPQVGLPASSNSSLATAKPSGSFVVDRGRDEREVRSNQHEVVFDRQRRGAHPQLLVGHDHPGEGTRRLGGHCYVRPGDVVTALERSQRRLEQSFGRAFTVLELDERSDAQHQRLEQLGPADTCPPSGCGQVGQVGRDRVEDRRAAVEVDVVLLGPTRPELGVGIASGDQLSGVVKPIERVSADRLEQSVPRLPAGSTPSSATSDLSAR